MTEADRGLVRRKLALIARNLDDLGPIAGLSVADFVGDRFRHKGTERLLQEVIEAAVDVNLHLLRVLGRGSATDYYTSFIALGEARVLPSDLAERLAPSAGVRNRLIHEYDDIDDAAILAAVVEARALFPRYIRAVEDFLAQDA